MEFAMGVMGGDKVHPSPVAAMGAMGGLHSLQLGTTPPPPADKIGFIGALSNSLSSIGATPGRKKIW